MHKVKHIVDNIDNYRNVDTMLTMLTMITISCGPVEAILKQHLAIAMAYEI